MSDSRRPQRHSRGLRSAVAGVFVLFCLSAPAANAQQVRYVKQLNLNVGVSLGVYFTGGGYDWGDQQFEYTGVHMDLVRFGFSQLVVPRFRMELAGLFGMSVLADPGYQSSTDVASGDEGQSNVGFHWGFSLGGYYRFRVGLTLGIAAELTFGFGKALDATFFRLVPAIGWEWAESLGEWFVHVRWATGLTMLNGIDEFNVDPTSNLTWTGLQVVYGF